MKRTLLTIALISVSTITLFGQGRVIFDNLGTGNAITIGPYSSPGASGGPVGAFAGANYSIQLLWAPQGSYPTLGSLYAAVMGSSTPVAVWGATGGSPTPDGAGLFDGGAVAMPVGTYTMLARAWFNNGQFATYDASLNAGRNTGVSQFLTITATAPPTPAEFASFPSFQIGIIPEPSTFALVALGVAGLLLFRRRK